MKLLIIAHTPSPNTQLMSESIFSRIQSDTNICVDVTSRSPFDTTPQDVQQTNGLLLLTTENLGYMSGAMKDFFDRCYYPCLEVTQGMPYALIIRAGHDGTGTRLAVERIVKGLRWRAVAEPLICRGPWQDKFLQDCEELGLAMAAGLDAGIF